MRLHHAAALLVLLPVIATAAGAAPRGRTVLEPIAGARWRFGGPLGARIDRNVDRWLLRAPAANPGLLDMFARRDRHLPYRALEPWAGEFAGKYLISAVQACRMSGDPRLRPAVARFVDALIGLQAPDGYLGPFPRPRRLLGECDLWGHYHCILGLLAWHDESGDRRALACALRAADAICRVYGPGGRRPIAAGNPNFNLAALHGIAELYLRTGRARYLALAQRFVDDLPADGDWLRGGLAGTPYYRLPGSGPRWEALHVVQGLGRLYEATGDPRYRRALLALWATVRQADRHPSGAFSTNEQASGTIYLTGSIETCCSVAWTALTIDALRLTGDARMADELELTLWNQALASQHPSGNWCTYDTPLNGVRAPSYQQISFQYRPGAPELNCCSVNGPRVLGMLSEWAVMRAADGVAVNFYGPGAFDVPAPGGRRVRIEQATAYPAGAGVTITLRPDRAARFAVRLRMPGWSARTTVAVNGAPIAGRARPGAYAVISRRWQAGDRITLGFDMTPRCQVGQGRDYGGRAAFTVGPLLLAYDAAWNRAETASMPAIDARRPGLHRVPTPADPVSPELNPIAMWEARTEQGARVRLCDFASAGARGTEYAGWVRAAHLPPTATTLLTPEPNAVGKPGAVLFRWDACGAPGDTYTLTIARDTGFRDPVLERTGLVEAGVTVAAGELPEGAYHWRVRTVSPDGVGVASHEVRAMRVDAAAPGRFYAIGPDGVLLAAALDGDPAPACGRLDAAEGLAPATDRRGRPGGAISFANPGARLRYAIPFFPGQDYAFAAWVCPPQVPASLGQIVSGWARGMDDPLRVTVSGGQVSARIEAGGAFDTAGVRLTAGRWTHVAAVKRGPTLTLYVDGAAQPSVAAPPMVRSVCRLIGIGFNPLYYGGERFTGAIDDVTLYARALTAAEVARMAAAR